MHGTPPHKTRVKVSQSDERTLEHLKGIQSNMKFVGDMNTITKRNKLNHEQHALEKQKQKKQNHY